MLSTISFRYPTGDSPRAEVVAAAGDSVAVVWLQEVGSCWDCCCSHWTFVLVCLRFPRHFLGLAVVALSGSCCWLGPSLSASSSSSTDSMDPTIPDSYPRSFCWAMMRRSKAGRRCGAWDFARWKRNFRLRRRIRCYMKQSRVFINWLPTGYKYRFLLTPFCWFVASARTIRAGFQPIEGPVKHFRIQPVICWPFDSIIHLSFISPKYR